MTTADRSAAAESASGAPPKERHPASLYILFATEMWERFGFYTAAAVMTLYLQRGGFGWSRGDATTLWSNYLMFVYAAPLIGGFLADKVLGSRRSVLIGGVLFTAGYVLLGPRARASEDWVGALDAGGQGAASSQQRWFNMGVGIMATSSSGAAALVAAMPLALPNRVKTPWWAWLSGGLGVGFAAFSIAYGVTAEPGPDTSCASLVPDSDDARACVKHAEQVSLSVLTGVTAAPLLTIPFVYLLRRTGANIAPGVEVSRAGGYVSFGGIF